MGKVQLKNAIDAVNKRYFNGQNDDDQVKRMIEIERKTKGYSFKPTYDTYELCTDSERLAHEVERNGYWSENVQRFNEVLVCKGGYDYMIKLNQPYVGTDNSKIIK